MNNEAKKVQNLILVLEHPINSNQVTKKNHGINGVNILVVLNSIKVEISGNNFLIGTDIEERS